MSQNGKLCLSKGQLTTCVLVGGAGYFGASSDRGKENLKETATRFPLVALYVITGSELVEKGFLTSSCCPAFVEYIRTNFPELSDNVSSVPSPMTITAKEIKKDYQKQAESL